MGKALIGTRSLATTIVQHIATYDDFDGQPLDESVWKALGGGCRIVYLHKPTGVVYKADMDGDYYDGYDNKQELTNARYLLKQTNRWFHLGPYLGIPPTSGFNVAGNLVVAMKYIDGVLGVKKQPSQPAVRALFNLGFGDMHGYNYLTDRKGRVWPIDLGSKRATRPGDHRDNRCLKGQV
jgi:hypothetical protein